MKQLLLKILSSISYVLAMVAFTVGVGCCAINRASNALPPSRYIAPNLPKAQLSLADGNTKEKEQAILHLHNKDGFFFCTAFVIDDNYAVTAAHCLVDEVGNSIRVHTSSDAFTGLLATVAGYDQRSDQGLLLGDFKAFNKVRMETETAEAAYATVLLTCGFPHAQKSVLCTPFEVIGAEDFMVAGKHAAMYPGMSGGPVVNLETGHIVAINSAVEGDHALVAPTIGLYGMFGIEP
jgi:S1-C subfamily serine protease